MAQLWRNRLELLKIPYVFFSVDILRWVLLVGRPIPRSNWRTSVKDYRAHSHTRIHTCIRFRYHDDVANCHIEFTRTDTWMSIMESTFQFAFPLRHRTWMHRGPYFVCSQSIAARLLSTSLSRRLFSRFVESPLGFGSNEIDWLCCHLQLS